MCSELKAVLGLSFKVQCVCVSTLTVILIAINDRQNSFFIQATCPEFEYQTERELREAVSLSHTHYMMQPFASIARALIGLQLFAPITSQLGVA